MIEETALMIAYKIHIGTPKAHEKRSAPHFARLDLMIEQACDIKAPEGLLLGDGVTTSATRAHQDGLRTRSAVRGLRTHG